MRESAGSFVGLQLLGGAVILISPAALEHEFVPNKDLFVGWVCGRSVTPGQDVVVGAACQNALTKGGIFDAEKAATATIEGRAEIGMKVRAETACGVEPNLIKHTREIDD